MNVYKIKIQISRRTGWSTYNLVKIGRHLLLKFLSTYVYVTHLIKIVLLFLYNYISCLHYSQPVDFMSGGSDNSSSSSVAAIVVPLVVLLLLTGIVVILVAVLVYQLIKYKRQSIE